MQRKTGVTEDVSRVERNNQHCSEGTTMAA